MLKGNIGVTSQDIFPLIKKFMYNDLDIFIREIVSNAIDATSKAKTLMASNEYPSVTEDTFKVDVILNKADHTITVTDHGIGMTEDEIEKYINQIAFSGANEFLEKYKDANIIGHFGLGFYSSFMVSDKVEIITKSYKEGSKACKWSCEGTTEFEITDAEKEEIGTDIIMYINSEYYEYLEEDKMYSLLRTYSRYLPTVVNLVVKQLPTTDASTGQLVQLEDKVTKVTCDRALWTEQPSSLTDEDYINFYHELYPSKPDPLFWIHINIDMPFTFTGILYFPAFDKNKPVFERKYLSLYCNRVYVTDNVDGILPEYLSLLHGVIDSPDIPLNVSRSFLQNDSNVKKISSHITTKVMNSLKSIMKEDREKYEEKWNTIKMFINLGVVTLPEVFDKAKDIILLTDTDNKKYTFDEYFDLVSENQKDKDNKVVYLYTYDTNAQYTYIDNIKQKGYNILVFNDQYSAFEIHTYESHLNDKNVIFKRIDADTIDKLIEKEDNTKTKELADSLKSMLVTLFDSVEIPLPDVKHTFTVKSMGKEALPITIITDEFTRRMKEMSILNNGGFFMNQKSTLNFVINSDAKVVKKILKLAKQSIGEDITNINQKIAESKEIEKKVSNDEVHEDFKNQTEDLIKEKSDIISKYANSEDHIIETLDIALLQYGLLVGEKLTDFIKRSVKMIEK